MTFPNVPDLPGVPHLLRSVANTAINNVVTALLGDDPSVTDTSASPQWGIFDTDSGDPVLVGDNVATFEFRKEYKILDYPIEDGSFESYNKVERSYLIRIAFTKGGSDADRTDFLNTLDNLVADLNTYQVITSDAIYDSANIVEYEMMRSAEKGAGLITVLVTVEQIRNSAVQSFTAAATPAGAATTDTGSVQPVAPTPAQTTTANDEASRSAAYMASGGQ